MFQMVIIWFMRTSPPLPPVDGKDNFDFPREGGGE